MIETGTRSLFNYLLAKHRRIYGNGTPRAVDRGRCQEPLKTSNLMRALDKSKFQYVLKIFFFLP